MHHYKQSKKQVAVRFFTYGVLTVAVLVLSGIGILTVLGYQFNFGSGNLEQTALVQFASQPTGATVTVDTKKLPGTTNTRTNLPSGSHTAVVSLTGYRDWQKTFNVTGGTVLWLNYALLIPQKLVTTDQGSLGSVTSDQTSPDKKWRLLTTSEKTDSLTLINFNDQKNIAVTTAALPGDALTKSDDGTTGSLHVVSWDPGSRYALVSYTYVASGTQTTDYLRYDRQNPTSVRNISKELGVTGITKIGFGDSSGNIYYALVGTDLRKLDIGGHTISQPLVTGVTQLYYTDGAETIAYARIEDDKTSIGIYRDAGGAITTNTYPTTPANLQVSYAEYYGYRYLATYHDGKVYLIQSPDSRSPSVVKSIDVPNVSWLYFNPSGRMLVAQSGNAFMTYDIETDHVYNQTLGANDASTRQFEWLDDFHLVNDAGGQISISDFDGANQQNLGADSPDTGAELSNDAQWLYSIASVDGKTVVQETALRVK